MPNSQFQMPGCHLFKYIINCALSFKFTFHRSNIIISIERELFQSYFLTFFGQNEAVGIISSSSWKHKSSVLLEFE